MRQSVGVILTAAILCSSLSACFPLVVGGVASATMVAADRRTSGAYLEDENIELKVSGQISQQLPAAHINVTSYNSSVLLTGEVGSEAQKQRAELIARGTPNVRQVFNYLYVGSISSLASRNNDTWITTKIRTRLLEGKGYSANAVKVVTERGVAYLMGIVTPQEGQIISQVVSQTAGVQEVVTLFQYLPSN